jgi:hypothetical protein
MVDPKYLVNISWNPARATGQQLVNIAGVTQSVPSYTEGYFIASMPELKISATGTSYPDALDNLLLVATSSSTIYPGTPPLNNTRTW